MSVSIVECNLLSSLLPYDPATKNKKTLKTALNEYKVLLIAVQQAIGALKTGDFDKFDALVGENMCQIRAIKIAMCSGKVLSGIGALEKKIEIALKTIEELSMPKQLHAMGMGQVSLGGLLVESDLDVALSEDEMFFVQAYLLTLVKVAKPSSKESPHIIPEVTDPKQFKLLDPDVSASFAHSVVKLVRKQLSAASVDFVQSEAINEEQALVSEEMLIEKNDCRILPFFFTNVILMHTAMKHKIPIVISLKTLAQDQGYRTMGQSTFFFTVDHHQFKYVKKTPGVKDLGKAAFIIEGMMCRPSTQLPGKTLKHALDQHDVVDLFLANSASHRQYPGMDHESLVEELENPEYQLYKKHAETIGCSFGNPTLFLIDHVYCDKVGKHLLVTKDLPPALVFPPQIAAVPKITDTIFSFLEDV